MQFRERRVVKTELQPELLEKLLNLPDGYEIFDAYWNKDSGTLTLYIRGDNIKPVILGSECVILQDLKLKQYLNLIGLG